MNETCFFLIPSRLARLKFKGAGARIGATVVTRDIFLDDLDNRDSIRLQLLKAEKLPVKPDMQLLSAIQGRTR